MCCMEGLSLDDPVAVRAQALHSDCLTLLWCVFVCVFVCVCDTVCVCVSRGHTGTYEYVHCTLVYTSM
jgi:hypothetical protein